VTKPHSRSAGLIAIVVIAGDRTGNADRLGALLVVAAAWWIGASGRRQRHRCADQIEMSRSGIHSTVPPLTFSAPKLGNVRVHLQLNATVSPLLLPN
jgi:hypothetical protein